VHYMNVRDKVAENEPQAPRHTAKQEKKKKLHRN